MKKNKSNNIKSSNIDTEKKLVIKEELETYGHVLNPLGNNRMLVKCFDGKERVCTIRGSMRKKVWINKNDIVLISLRDFQDDKADIIYRYDDNELKKLKLINELREEKNDENIVDEKDIFDFDDI